MEVHASHQSNSHNHSRHISLSLTLIFLIFIILNALTIITYRSAASPARSTTVILAEQKEQLKAAHEVTAHEVTENYKLV